MATRASSVAHISAVVMAASLLTFAVIGGGGTLYQGRTNAPAMASLILTTFVHSVTPALVLLFVLPGIRENRIRPMLVAMAIGAIRGLTAGISAISYIAEGRIHLQSTISLGLWIVLALSSFAGVVLVISGGIALWQRREARTTGRGFDPAEMPTDLQDGRN